MEIIVAILIVTIAVIIIKDTFYKGDTNRSPKEINYKYSAKQHLMTPSEERFFSLLNDTVSDEYYVFPQIHLSALFDHRIKGQNWKGAFAHINSKSVDYVLCDRQTLKPVYVIELDDHTHRQENRIKRDARVEKIFAHAGVPLVRFADIKSINREDIIAKLS